VDRYGAEYIDADHVVHQLYAAGTPETQAIAARFGPDLLRDDGTIDRRRLGDIVMKDASALRELEGILDPSVRAAIDDRIAHTSASVVVLDAIRLIEGGLYRRCDAVWVVVCDRALQIARLQSTRAMTAEQAELRVAAQRPIAEKLQHATAVVRNNQTFDALMAEVDEAWRTTVQPCLR